ncbi:MAG TPA: hypothetical protein VKP60_12445, partial [Magnetospirillaceae bacterium]|nr:hypothetical protein [Magnetospirillaceae bacterium]
MTTISDLGKSTNDWSDAQNWSGGVIPGAADTVIIKYQVDVTTAEAAENLTVGGLVFSATGQLTVNSLTVGTPPGTGISIQMNGGSLTAGALTFSSSLPLIELTYGTFDVQSAAPTSWSGSLSVGPVNGLPVTTGQSALLEFASGGIQMIEAGGTIAINGSANYLADAGSLLSNSALSSLSSNLGSLNL